MRPRHNAAENAQGLCVGARGGVAGLAGGLGGAGLVSAGPMRSGRLVFVGPMRDVSGVVMCMSNSMGVPRVLGGRYAWSIRRIHRQDSFLSRVRERSS